MILDQGYRGVYNLDWGGQALTISDHVIEAMDNLKLKRSFMVAYGLKFKVTTMATSI